MKFKLFQKLKPVSQLTDSDCKVASLEKVFFAAFILSPEADADGEALGKVLEACVLTKPTRGRRGVMSFGGCVPRDDRQRVVARERFFEDAVDQKVMRENSVSATKRCSLSESTKLYRREQRVGGATTHNYNTTSCVF